MKTLILYGSKHGCTEDVANTLAKQLNRPVEVKNIEDANVDLSSYYNIVLGSSIYAGQMNKKLKKYIKEHEAELKEKAVSVFLCRGQADDQFDKVLKENLPEIYDSIKYKGDFGGEFRKDRMGFMEKKLINMISKKTGGEEPIVSASAIQMFVENLNNE
ncbi:menaquinone-dependent protoporphyrinogen oxidase [Breznakia sp. PF5-3]|uniref:flavodoxin domain-containing protein n=1 Tax=unclassified Breznakia TaxID=2623764 RepID=UPI0024062F30|nr:MULTISPECIES: flavodoxin domain-containing protein [unclassified Breznakia]MDF9824315.1 menaquinone-dependent protoporphyrinogen oxidase [Breznakia sp. PM6-1]MDF9835094.1 menaquinone-dependent protoporphyrinogen oxidase [Breznakia sp. PF5-3]MDF9838466.1 menaquinone-dependent protoporphyrinogen oxidase [Breznakia sp. PFB2-8]MDF9860524.1 menaquinone-dependent protoporphyrinogen oxidase [Breznakia sp. PH5-24]